MPASLELAPPASVPTVEPALFADPMRPLSFVVRRVARETRDAFTLTLAPATQDLSLPFAPGQFTMLSAFGVGEVPISISGDPTRPDLLVHTIRAVGAVTRALVRMRPGDWVGVRGPFGKPWPVEQARARDVVVMAGGIGLAPLRPLVHQVLAERGRYGRLDLLYGARTPADVLYPRELKHWRGRFDATVDVTVDRGTSGWQGPVGVVTTLLERAVFDPASAVAFVCGPEVMMRFAVQALTRRGLAPTDVFVSVERNMKCGVGLCGHCQLGPRFVCKDGPVFRYDEVERLLGIREV